MKNRQSFIKSWSLLALSLLTLCLASVAQEVVAQQQQAPDDHQEYARRLWDEGLLQKRPAAQRTAPRRNYTYRRVNAPSTSKTAGAQAETKPGQNLDRKETQPSGLSKELTGNSVSLIGITFWRLRPSTATDDKGARLLVQDRLGTQAVEWMPERIEAETPVTEGQFVRLSIESPSTGYLYVIDREQCKDGKLGDPYLIFPTKRTRGGDNAVTAGRVIEIPAQEDTPPYFNSWRCSRPESK